jgi:hypothetical protein
VRTIKGESAHFHTFPAILPRMFTSQVPLRLLPEIIVSDEADSRGSHMQWGLKERMARGDVLSRHIGHVFDPLVWVQC